MQSGTDNEAVSRGYTKPMLASSIQGEFACLARPGDDMDGVVKVFDTDNQEWIRLNGWNWSFEDLD
jgi:hypothetical protein